MQTFHIKTIIQFISIILIFRTKCKLLANESGKISQDQFSNNHMCSKCGSFWGESNFKLKVKRQRLRTRPRYLKLVEKFDSSRTKGTASGLTQKQKKRAKWLKKRMFNAMDIICGQCDHKSSVRMTKPFLSRKAQKMMFAKEEEQEKVEEECEAEVENVGKRKRKSKVKNAGLKIPVAKDQNKLQDNKREDCADSQEKKAKINTTAKKAVIANTYPKKLQANSTQPKTISNSDKNRKKPPQSQQKVIISKTQQKNSILQLAALLKKKNESTGYKMGVDQDRLQRLLK